MERVTNHERPGVYSAYTATAAAQRGNRRGVAAVVAVSQKGTAGTLYALGSYRQAAETFGAEDGLTALVKILLANGAARVLAGIEHLLETCTHLTVVTNEVFSGGAEYAGDTLAYLKDLAWLNRVLARRADRVVELVCGLPNVLKEAP